MKVAHELPSDTRRSYAVFFKLIKPLVVSAGKRALEGDFPKLKELMEARAS